MRRLLGLLVVVVSCSALGQVHIDIPLPTIRFDAPPPLVVVTPGVQVVPDHDDEIFFVDGWYWHRRGPHWFRTRTHGGGWVVVDAPLVPPALVKVPPGHYRRFKPRRAAVRAATPVVPVPVLVPAPHPHGGKGKGKHKH